MLDQRDYSLIVDKSGSMGTEDMPGGKSRWMSMQESTLQISREISKLDPDGITLYVFDGGFKRYDNVTTEKVADVFRENRPGGSTDLAGVLEHALADFHKRKAANQLKANGDIMLIVTDGVPDDADAVKRVIAKATQGLSNGDGEIGLSFIQIGRDQGASRFLKELDDALTSGPYKAKFDIVDTKTMDEVDKAASFSDILMAALND